MKEALFYKKEGNRAVCELCPRQCIIEYGKVGMCGVRKNTDGKLISLVYERPCAVHMDPIEKKPLYHFHPQEMTLSIGTAGCNLACGFCQNWEISKEFGGEAGILKGSQKLSPREVIDLCKKNKSKIISFTYTEPTVFFEYMLDTAKLAKKEGIKCVIVSNGYIEEAPLRLLCPYIDAANIDLKGFSNDFYMAECGGKLEPILRSLIILKEEGVWVEVTNLIIPKANDDLSKIESMAEWIEEKLGRGTPLHLSRFHPDYKSKDIAPTSVTTLQNAMELCYDHLDFVYVGNVVGDVSTFCPACKTELIVRNQFKIVKNIMNSSSCPTCGFPVPGIWKF